VEKAPAGLASGCGARLQQGPGCRSRAPAGTSSPTCIAAVQPKPTVTEQTRGDRDVGLATRKCVWGPVLGVSSRSSGLDRSAIVLSPGQTRGRETLPCGLCKIKKPETKVGRGK